MKKNAILIFYIWIARYTYNCGTDLVKQPLTVSYSIILTVPISVTRKNRQKLHKNDFTRKLIDLSPLQKLPKNVRDLDKLIVAKGFKKSPKVQ